MKRHFFTWCVRCDDAELYSCEKWWYQIIASVYVIFTAVLPNHCRDCSKNRIHDVIDVTQQAYSSNDADWYIPYAHIDRPHKVWWRTTQSFITAVYVSCYGFTYLVRGPCLCMCVYQRYTCSFVPVVRPSSSITIFISKQHNNNNLSIAINTKFFAYTINGIHVHVHACMLRANQFND